IDTATARPEIGPPLATRPRGGGRMTRCCRRLVHSYRQHVGQQTLREGCPTACLCELDSELVGLADSNHPTFPTFELRSRSLAERFEFPLEAAVEDREAAPGFGVEVFIIKMERRRVPLALPLVAAPEGEEAFDPRGELLRVVLGELRADGFPDFDGHELVADRGALDRVEEAVGHEVAFVGLVGAWRTKFRSGALVVDDGERGERADAHRAG